MTTYVQTTGLELPSVQLLIGKFEIDEHANISPVLNVSSAGLAGQFNGIFGSHAREAYEIAQHVYNGFDPDAAEDDQLDNIGAIRGTPREGATKARFGGTKRLTVNLEPGATLPIGSIAHVVGEQTNRFLSTEPMTNSGGVAADFDVAFEAETAGIRIANIGTVIEIPTPVPGWNSVTNTTLPIPGTEREEDPAYRLRQELELRARGSGTARALRADLLAYELDGENVIADAKVLENVEDFADPVTGLPAHSFEAIIDDSIATLAPDDDVAQVIWDTKPQGIKTYGGVTASATDEFGNPQAVNFSRVEYVYHSVDLELTIDPVAYVGDAAIKSLVLEASLTQATGKRVRWSTFVDAVREAAGVVAVTGVELQFLTGPVVGDFVDLVPQLRQRPTVQVVGDVTLTTVDEASE